MAVEIPQALRELLEGTKAEAPVLALAEAAGTLLGDNEMPFFPAFTDHGSEHVDRVLEAAVGLIPRQVWEEELLHPADAAALASAAMLHDLAMHVRESGFVELVENGEFEAQPWFDADQPGRKRDLPWPHLWSEFQREARHFGTSQLELLLGREAASCPVVAFQEQLDPSQWTLPDRLLVGEFLRRHHARLAHEIAMYGFPGATPEDFPVLAKTLPDLANAIGALARSHGEDLRAMLDYVRFLEPRNKRPEGVLLIYGMGLLRVADYLQIDADRAPPLLLRLKKPQSRLSVEEWTKHKAVASITPDSDDPYGISVTVSRDHGLRTHLALADLFEDMQREMDTSVAVIDEVYGRSELGALGLTRRRVITNLDQPSLHRHLDYVPRRAALRSDPDLFRLVIRDLYGNQPAVAGRELIQNAVDAVRVRQVREKVTGAEIPDSRFRDLEADVEVTFEADEDGKWLLRIADRGIGMTPDLVIDYFLQAGASFGPTGPDLGDEEEAPMKAGRFGVGAFAAFLLGQEMRVRTRHVDEERGISFRARIDENLVELEWADVPFGTEVTIPFDGDSVSFGWPKEVPLAAVSNLQAQVSRFYRLAKPTVAYVVCDKTEQDGEEERSVGPGDVPAPGRRIPDRWRSLRDHGMDAVLWQVPHPVSYRPSFREAEGGPLTHNGIAIEDLEGHMDDREAYYWSDSSLGIFLRCPLVAVFDRQHALRIALHRYRLVDPTLPFEDRLLQSIGSDILAHALAAGAAVHPLQSGSSLSPVYTRTGWMPPLPALLSVYGKESLLILWRGHDPYLYGERTRTLNPSLDQFVAQRGRVGWRRYPFRAGVYVEAPSRGPREEREQWGLTVQAVVEESQKWARILGAGEAEIVVLRGEEEHSIGINGGSVDQDRIDPDLRSAAFDLRESSGSDAVYLTAVKGFGTVRQKHQHVVAEWERSVGGLLPRVGRQRDDAVERILSDRPSLRPLYNKWQRMLDPPAEPR